jgi:transcriptional regulator with XRE-family HTH domain
MNHLSQKELADRIGLSAASITYIERGVRVFNKDTFYKVCSELRVDPSWLDGTLPLDPIVYISAKAVDSYFEAAEDNGVGNRIRISRLKLGWSSTELAEKIGLKVQCISSYETGSVFPPGKVLARLANALGVSVAWLRTGEDDTQAYPITKDVLKFLQENLEARKILSELLEPQTEGL